jgi:hypothetical protein
VSDTEGDADDESVGSDEEIGVEKPFACEAENCVFSHRSEWGIKKHYMVNRLFLLYIPKVFLLLSFQKHFNPLSDAEIENCCSAAKQTFAHFIIPTSFVSILCSLD